MRTLYQIKDMIDDELKTLSKKEELTAQDLDNVYKMVDICKDITTIEAMNESKYSREYSREYSSENYPMSMDGSYRSYARGGSYGSYARGGRDGDGDGRYSERGSYREGGSYRDGGYSGHEQTKEKLEAMMRKAGSEQERESIRRIIEQL